MQYYQQGAILGAGDGILIIPGVSSSVEASGGNVVPKIASWEALCREMVPKSYSATTVSEFGSRACDTVKS